MSRRYTTAFDASEELVAMLVADGLAGATILWGMPSEAQAAAEELVVVADVTDPTDEETAALGMDPQPRRRESYVVEVVVDVAKHTDDHATVNRRARDLVHAIERVVDSDETLNGALHADGWCQPASLTIQQLRAEETGAFRTVATRRFGCTARI